MQNQESKILVENSQSTEEISERNRLNEISEKIIDCCITVHKIMGPGLLESIYEQCLMKEFEIRGIKARNQVPVDLFYKGFILDRQLRIDILVEESVILELKSCDKIIPVYEAQIISHLKLMDKRLGFLLNFNVKYMKEGISRFVNNFH